MEKEADVVWDVSDVDLSTAGSYEVIASVIGYWQPIPTILEVIVNEPMGQKTISVFSLIGVEPILPETVEVLFKNGVMRELEVQWQTDSFNIYEMGTTIIFGTLVGYDYQVEATIKIVEDYIVE